MHPKTDIICLVHNSLAVTEGFVQNIQKHTDNYRLIFVDNGSDKETADFLRKGEGLWDLVRSDVNLGVIGGRNLGVKHITADFFMNIDNDQFVREGWLDALHSLMDKGFDIVGPEAWCLHPPDRKGVVQIGTSTRDRSYYPYRHCKNSKDKFTYIGCGGMLVKTEVYRDIGLFDERFGPAYFEDPDFCFRAIKAGYKLGWLPNCPITHLAHQTMNHQVLFLKNPQFLKSWSEFQSKWHPYFPKPMQME